MFLPFPEHFFLQQWKVTATIFINKNCGLCLPMMGDGDNKGGGIEDISTIWSIKIVNFIFLMMLGLNMM